jgi:hypothetical protein
MCHNTRKGNARDLGRRRIFIMKMHIFTETTQLALIGNLAWCETVHWHNIQH